MQMRMIINSKISRLGFVCVMALGLLTACADSQPAAEGNNQSPSALHKQSYYVFGTVLDVLVWAPKEKQPALENALLNVEEKLNAMHHQWHAWKPGRLQAINAALRHGQRITLSDEEARFLQRVKALSQASEGTFEPAIGELVHLWGFHADEFPLHTPPPDATAINQWLQQRPSMTDLHLAKKGESMQLWGSNPRIWLDFGGVVKGYATDVVAKMLQQAGFTDVIINAGGDVLVNGQKGAAPWRVAIRAPGTDWPGDILAVIESHGREAIFTSGNYQRYTRYNGTRYAHILDPATGWPVPDVVSATVIADNGTLADAAATAMIVAGWQRWPRVARQLGLKSVLLLGEDGRCEISPGMAGRLKNSRLHCQLRPVDAESEKNPSPKPAPVRHESDQPSGKSA